MAQPTALTFALAGVGDRGTILRWLVREGEPVAAGQPVVEVDTDKVVVELTAPCAGLVLKIDAHEGAQVGSGETLAWIGEGTPRATEPQPLQLRAHALCPGCGTSVALNGPWLSLTCIRCGCQGELDPSWWSDVLLRVARDAGTHTDREGWRVKVTGSRGAPACHNCSATLPVDAGTPMHEVRCGGCGLAHECRAAPAWLTAAHPTAVRIVGDLQPPAVTIPTQCPHCRAAVHPRTRAPCPRCQHCGRDIENAASPSVPRAWAVLRSLVR